MRSWLRAWVAPTFGDEETNRRARLLNVMTWSGLGLLLVVNGSLVVTTMQRGERSSTLLAAATMVGGLIWAGAILFFSRQGRVAAGSHILLWGGVAMTVVTNLTDPNSHLTDPGWYLFLVIVVAAALLLGTRWAMIFAVSETLLYVACALLSAGGYVPRTIPRPPANIPYAVAMTGGAIIALSILGWLFGSGLENALRELRAINVDLDRRVAERTQELTEANRQLARANEQLRSLDQAKSNFVSIVSHELRAPLTSVLGFSRLMQRQFDRHIAPHVVSDDAKVQRAVRHIQDNLQIITLEGARLTRLINDVLDLTKMEAGRSDWHMDAVRIEEVIGQAVHGVEGLAAGTGVPLEVEVASVLPTLYADRDALVRVVMNLLSNALKFTAAGNVRLRVWAVEPGEDIPSSGLRSPNVQTGLPTMARMVAVSVEDTGIGIAEDDLEKLFQKFRQVGEQSDRRRQPGTGLGLSICKEIVEQHGGRIWAESRAGVGSRFVLTLPSWGGSS